MRPNVDNVVRRVNRVADQFKRPYDLFPPPDRVPVDGQPVRVRRFVPLPVYSVHPVLDVLPVVLRPLLNAVAPSRLLEQ